MPRSFKLRGFKPKKNKLKTQKNHTKYNSHKKNKKIEQIYNLDNNDGPFSDVAEPKIYYLRGGTGEEGKPVMPSTELPPPFSDVLDPHDIPTETKSDVPVATTKESDNIPIATTEESNEVKGDKTLVDVSAKEDSVDMDVEMRGPVNPIGSLPVSPDSIMTGPFGQHARNPNSKALEYIKRIFGDDVTENKMNEDELFKNLYENPEDFFYFEEVGKEY